MYDGDLSIAGRASNLIAQASGAVLITMNPDEAADEVRFTPTTGDSALETITQALHALEACREALVTIDRASRGCQD